jgi:phosphohistidine phosphatase
MQIYVLRHGIAEDGAPGGRDADRSLTAEGRKKLREVLRLALRADVSPSLIITSPYLRAVQTAEVAVEVLGYDESLLKAEALVPSSSPEGVWDEIRNHKGLVQLMLVGHEPLLSRVVAYLLGAPSIQVDLKKAALVRIDIDSFGPQPRGMLKWMLVPKLAL